MRRAKNKGVNICDMTPGIFMHAWQLCEQNVADSLETFAFYLHNNW